MRTTHDNCSVREVGAVSVFAAEAGQELLDGERASDDIREALGVDIETTIAKRAPSPEASRMVIARGRRNAALGALALDRSNTLPASLTTVDLLVRHEEQLFTNNIIMI